MLPLRATAVKVARTFGLYHPLRDLRRERRFRRDSAAKIAAWEKAGRPALAPDLLKYEAIRECAQRCGISILVETGTLYGNALFTLRRDFRELHSIELAPALYEQNRRELGHLRHIHLHFGDSAEVLPRILPRIPGPALFWLDGHYCAGPSARAVSDPPIGTELDHLLRRPAGGNVVLIDDARLFDGRNGYPTLAEIREFVSRLRPQATFEVALDIIRIAPV